MRKNRRTNKLYLAVGIDKYEYIIFLCDTLQELSHWSGWSVSRLRFFITQNKVDFRNKCKYKKIFF